MLDKLRSGINIVLEVKSSMLLDQKSIFNKMPLTETHIKQDSLLISQQKWYDQRLVGT